MSESNFEFTQEATGAVTKRTHEEALKAIAALKAEKEKNNESVQ